MGKSKRSAGPGFRARFLRTFREKFFLRFHMTLIMAAVMLSGVLSSKLMWMFGVTSMAVRYPLAVVCSYGVFFLLLRIWLAYVDVTDESTSDVIGDAVDVVADGVDGAGALVDFASMGSSRGVDQAASHVGGSGGGGGSWGLGDIDGDGEGLVILVVLAVLILVVLCCGAYVVWEAPSILAEAAFQMVLATSLRRRARQIDSPGWTGSVLLATWWPFAIVLVIAGVFGYVATSYCPGATRLPDVLQSCTAPAKV